MVVYERDCGSNDTGVLEVFICSTGSNGCRLWCLGGGSWFVVGLIEAVEVAWW